MSRGPTGALGRLIVAASLAASGVACQPQAQLAPDVAESATPDTPAQTAAPATLHDDLRIIDLPVPAEGSGGVAVELLPGDTSVLLVVTAADVTDTVFIDGATSPDGDQIDPDQVENAGQNAMLVPAVDDQLIVPGTWEFQIDVDGQIRSVQAVIKSSDPFAVQQIDVVFHVVSSSGRLDAQADVDEVLVAWAERGREILEPHGLRVGSMVMRTVPEDIVRTFSELELVDDNDPPLRELCQALTGLQGSERALAVGIVDLIVDADGQADGTEGIAAGSPGAAVVGGSTSCVTVIADGDRDLLELGTTVWHEVGHVMGLLHTTEAEGDVFDELADTPECDAVNDADGDGFLDEFECEGLDGANVMFHDSDGTEMTAGQAFVLRNHPLMRPVVE